MQQIATRQEEKTHLPVPSAAPFKRAIVGGYSIVEAERMGSLPLAVLRQDMARKRKALGEELTRHECENCLRLLALALPRAGLSPADANDMLDLYFGLLHKAGVTGKMLTSAAERYVMMPTGLKGKFFPDPGQLAEMCAGDIRDRRLALEALEKARSVLDGPAPPELESFSERGGPVGERLFQLGEAMRVESDRRGSVAVEEAGQHRKPTGRDHTDANELLSLVGKKIGKTPEQLRRDHQLPEGK